MITLLLTLGACAPKTDTPAVPATTETAPGLPSPDTRLPRTPDLLEGTLDNGLDWYIRPNTEPAGRAELRLVVRVGSVYEDDDQQGLAHLLEHMAFNGTATFAEDELVATLEGLGMSFGAHTNAHTSTDETVYKLRVPTDDPVALDTAFTVLGDWAHAMTLADDAIERERGVVLEEWRRTRGVGGRIRDATWPTLWGDSPYADRLPIGTEESLTTFEPDAVRRFYTDWYRPDMMAVVAVGDFDVAEIQARIEATFGVVEAAGERRSAPDFSDTPQADHVVVLADPEISRTSAELDHRFARTEDGTYGGYRDRLIDGLMLGALQERCRTLGLSDDPPFLGCAGGRQRITPYHEVDVAVVGTQDEELIDGLDALLVELERLRRHGVTQGELDRLRTATLSHFAGLAAEQEATASSKLAEELIRVIITGESVPGIVHENEIVQAVLPTLTLDDVNATAGRFLPPGNRHIEILMPAREGLTPPTEDQILALMAEVATRDIAPPVEVRVEGPLIATLPEPGTITERTSIDSLGVEIWTLSNGAQVWLKPTDFKQDQVLFKSWSPGGRSMIDDAGFVHADAALGIRTRSGVGDWPSAELGLRLQGIRATVSPNMGRYHEGLSASASPEFLEEMFQLVWLNYTAPRFTAEALESWRDGQLASARNRGNKPEHHFDDAYQRLMWSDNPRLAPWREDSLAQVELAPAQAFYEGRFAHAGDHLFIVVGAFDPATLEPLLTRYLASLPAQGEPDQVVPDSAVRSTGVHEETVYAGLDDKARLKWRFHGSFENTSDNRVALGAMADVLDVLLREELREKRGGVYSVSVRPRYYLTPHAYTLTIEFQCDPDRLEELEAATEAIIRGLQTDGVDDDKVAAVRAINARNWETSLETNSFWRNQIKRSVEHGQELEDLIGGYDARNAALTAAVVQEVAGTYLDFEQYVLVRLMPEAAGGE